MSAVSAEPTADVAAELATHKEGIAKAYRSETAARAEIGQRLRAVKALVGHGGFTQWVADNCPFKLRAAQYYLSLVGEAKSATVALLPEAPALAYVAVGKSTPAAAREEILTRVEAGEDMPVARAREIVQQHKQPTPIRRTLDDVRADWESGKSAVYDSDDEDEAAQIQAFRTILRAASELETALRLARRDHELEALRGVAERVLPMEWSSVGRFAAVLEEAREVFGL